jgi:translation elongation factor EF-1alpha
VSGKKCETKDEKKDEKLGKPIGAIEHFYSKLGVGIIKLKEGLKAGEKIKIKGHTTDNDMTADSIQIDHKDVKEAKKGDVVGVKVPDKVREDDQVYKAE